MNAAKFRFRQSAEFLRKNSKIYNMLIINILEFIKQRFSVGFIHFISKKVFNKAEKLFCTVGAICNLVEEFNGLVSTKGSASAGPLVFYRVLSCGLCDLSYFLMNTHNQKRKTQNVVLKTSQHCFKNNFIIKMILTFTS